MCRNDMHHERLPLCTVNDRIWKMLYDRGFVPWEKKKCSDVWWPSFLHPFFSFTFFSTCLFKRWNKTRSRDWWRTTFTFSLEFLGFFFGFLLRSAGNNFFCVWFLRSVTLRNSWNHLYCNDRYIIIHVWLPTCNIRDHEQTNPRFTFLFVRF